MKLNEVGAAIAHSGFALLILGALISQSKQHVISFNKEGIDFGDNFDTRNKFENKLLVKDKPKTMGDYVVKYIGDSTLAPNTFYKVRYQKVNEELEVIDEFTLAPYAQVNPNMGLIASPDTRHYWDKDIYSHVSSVPDKSSEDFQWKYRNLQNIELAIGDTLVVNGIELNLKKVTPIETQPGSIATRAMVELKESGKKLIMEPIFRLENRTLSSKPFENEEYGIVMNFVKINPEKETFSFEFAKGEREVDDYIIMKAIVFPFINILWLGCIVMILGFSISIYQRISR